MDSVQRGLEAAARARDARPSPPRLQRRRRACGGSGAARPRSARLARAHDGERVQPERVHRARSGSGRARARSRAAAARGRAPPLATVRAEEPRARAHGVADARQEHARARARRARGGGTSARRAAGSARREAAASRRAETGAAARRATQASGVRERAAQHDVKLEHVERDGRRGAVEQQRVAPERGRGRRVGGFALHENISRPKRALGRAAARAPPTKYGLGKRNDANLAPSAPPRAGRRARRRGGARRR